MDAVPLPGLSKRSVPPISLLLLLEREAASRERDEHSIELFESRCLTGIIRQRVGEVDFTEHFQIVSRAFELSVVFLRRKNIEDLRTIDVASFVHPLGLLCSAVRRRESRRWSHSSN